MTAVNPSLIKELRDRTGISVGKCKEALVEAQGDIEVALANLRRAGISAAAKKEERVAKEGVIAVVEKGDIIAIVEINAETDFVVRNDRFQEFVRHIAEEAVNTKPATLQDFLKQPYSKDRDMTIDAYRASLVQAIGENIQIRRLQIFTRRPNHSISAYSHLGGKVVAVVEISGSESEKELSRDLAMHVAALNPTVLTPQEISDDLIQKETELSRAQTEGKTEEESKLHLDRSLKALREQHSLLLQHFIKNDSLTISELLNQRSHGSGRPLQVALFQRWKVGEN